MKCPRDGTALQRVVAGNVQLDKCHQCDGIWLDEHEMETLVASDVTGIEELIENRYGDPPIESGAVDGYMRCPKCDDGRLVQYQYTYLNPVKIDRCDSCMGIWLDDTELDAVAGESKNLEKIQKQFRVETFVKSFLKSWSKK